MTNQQAQRSEVNSGGKKFLVEIWLPWQRILRSGILIRDN